MAFKFKTFAAVGALIGSLEGYQLNVQAIFVFRNFLRDFCNLLFGTNNHADFNVVWIFFILTAAYQCQ